MGVFRPLVEKMQRPEGYVSPYEVSDRIVTPATTLSASRLGLAIKARNDLVEGKKGAAAWAAVAFMTDAADGWLARFISDRRPNTKLGVSKFGEQADFTFDTLAILLIAEGALRGPRVSKLGKAAVATVVAQEGSKLVWAAERTLEYKNATNELLTIPVTLDGKEAMVEKMVGVGAAVLTNEFDNPAIRLSLGTAALSFAGVGSWRGEQVRQQNEAEFLELMGDFEPRLDAFVQSLGGLLVTAE